MKTEFDIQLTEKDLYGFNIYQTYTGFNGWLSIFVGVLFFATAATKGINDGIMYVLLYLALGVLFIVYIPVSLWGRVKLTMKTNKVLAGTLHYEVSPEAIKVSQGEETGELPWEDIYKIVGNSKRVLIYSGRKNAYIIPRSQLGDNYEQLFKIAKDKLDKYRLKMK